MVHSGTGVDLGIWLFDKRIIVKELPEAIHPIPSIANKSQNGVQFKPNLR